MSGSEKVYLVKQPVSGWRVWTVRANSAEEAAEKAGRYHHPPLPCEDTEMKVSKDWDPLVEEAPEPRGNC